MTIYSAAVGAAHLSTLGTAALCAGALTLSATNRVVRRSIYKRGETPSETTHFLFYAIEVLLCTAGAAAAVTLTHYTIEAYGGWGTAATVAIGSISALNVIYSLGKRYLQTPVRD